MTNCQTCREQIDSILSDLPSLWRLKISESICKVFEDLDSNKCEAVRDCETLTVLSEFRREGSKVCITYTDEDSISYERCFDFIDIINSLIDEVDPKCLAPKSIWANLTFTQRIQLMINTACNVSVNTIFTTTSTTSTSSTSTSSTSTTSSSTTTSTTETPVCGCFSIQNLTPSIYPVIYDNCGPTAIPLILSAGEKKYLCSTFNGITQSVDQVIDTHFLGDCSVCAALNATTTTTSTSTSTTTTTSSTTTTTTLCETPDSICIKLVTANSDPNTLTQIIPSGVILGGYPSYLNVDIDGNLNNYITFDTTTNCWQLMTVPSIVLATRCNASPIGTWIPDVSSGIISMTVQEVNQFGICIEPSPTTTTTTTCLNSGGIAVINGCQTNGGSALPTACQPGQIGCTIVVGPQPCMIYDLSGGTNGRNFQFVDCEGNVQNINLTGGQTTTRCIKIPYIAEGATNTEVSCN